MADAQRAPEEGWSWWAGRNDEVFQSGPHGSREDAIEAGRGDFDGEGFHIVEAAQHRIRFSARDLIERDYFENEDWFDGEHGEPDRVGNPEAIKDADDELQQLLDDWVARHRHTFVPPWLFAATRNAAFIPAEQSSEDEAA